MNKNSLFNPYWREGQYQLKIQAYYYQEFKNYITPNNHRHCRAEIMYIVKGDCEVLIGSTSVPMKKGDFILIDTDIFHRLKVNEEGCRILNIEFFFHKKFCPFFTIDQLIMYMPNLKKFFSIQAPYILLKDPEERLGRLIRSLIGQLDNLEIGNDFTRQMLIGEILMTISNIYNQAKKVEKDPKSQYVAQAIEYIHQYYDYNLTVADIAKQVNLHERYLQHLFKKKTGYTVNAYLTKTRLKKAKQLLACTNIEISKICDYIGVNSQQYFSYLFKKHVGVSPQNYRKEKMQLGIKGT
ncbi:AraC family transcriptional regulator [Crassaminicella thermophila]|uniref:AraC family transcriptional regulator n=1 Tax=Crassaminicella thermophila TaxID=2599308 RepID=A0A5C0SB27_CRATE|nr:helix-turn-helix domain-containing protein [Crassaminicella thermophila]QEK11785.1 AraC family transcriptional regulator [Crassaminicella thermophila]